MPELMPAYERVVELAGGGDLAARMLSLYKPPPYLAACSQGVWTRDGGPVLARNYDYAPSRFEGLIWSTACSSAAVIGTSDCLWGLLDGMNDAGLAVSLTFGGRRVMGDGFGIPIVVRYLLETCANVAEAREALARLPYSLAHNLTWSTRRRGAHRLPLARPRADLPCVPRRHEPSRDRRVAGAGEGDAHDRARAVHPRAARGRRRATSRGSPMPSCVLHCSARRMRAAGARCTRRRTGRPKGSSTTGGRRTRGASGSRRSTRASTSRCWPTPSPPGGGLDVAGWCRRCAPRRSRSTRRDPACRRRDRRGSSGSRRLGRRRPAARVRPARDGRRRADGDRERLGDAISRSCSSGCCPRDDRYAHRHGSVGHGGDHCCRCSCRRRSWCRWWTGRAARHVAVDRAGRSEPGERRAHGPAQLRPGAEGRGVVRGTGLVRVRSRRGRRDRLDVALAQQDEVLAVELDLEARRRAGRAPGRPPWPRGRRARRAPRRPTRAAWARAPPSRGSAGLPRVLRSPFSGARTTSRSPVRRIAAPLAVILDAWLPGLRGRPRGGLLRRGGGLGHLAGV